MADLRISGRGWAYIGAALGGIVSIAANVAHSYVPPTGAALGWTPKPGAVVGAVFWPVALFVATEILTRVAWPSGRIWQLMRWGGMFPVAAVAALVSYRHLSGLLAYYGEEALTCVLGPIAVDGLMVMSTGALLATGMRRLTETVSAATSLATAVPDDAVRPAAPSSADPQPSTSITTQSVPADPPAPDSADPAGMPEPAPAEPIPTPAQVADRINPTTPGSTPARPAAPRPAPRPNAQPRKAAAPTTSTTTLAASATDTPVTEPKPAQLALPIAVEAETLRRADALARQYRTEHGTPITAGQLAARLRVNSDQAAHALAILGLGPDNPTQNIPTVNGTPVKATR